MSKDEYINLLRNTDLTEKKEIIKHKSLALYKMGKEIKIYGSIEVEKPKFH